METIRIEKPADIKSKKFYNTLKKKVNDGCKNINIEMAFVTDNPKLLLNEFQVMKNKLCFKRDIENNKFNQ